MKRLSAKISLGAALLLATTQMAAAHPGHEATGLLSGLAHPFTGLDHALAMLAVGFIAARQGGKAMWFLPLSFVAAMLAGGLVGFAGFELHAVEAAIMASLVVFAGMLIFARSLPMLLAAGVIAGFGLFHGFAHVAEMPANASSFAYASGFVVATCALHATGLGLGLIIAKLNIFGRKTA